MSLSEADVAFIDGFAEEHGVESRSAVVQRAVALLRVAELGSAYAEAWDEWAAEDEAAWGSTAGDGLSRA